MSVSTPQWISVAKYAEKYNLKRGKIYMDFYFGRLGERAKKEKIIKETILLLDVPPVKVKKYGKL